MLKKIVLMIMGLGLCAGTVLADSVLREDFDEYGTHASWKLYSHTKAGVTTRAALTDDTAGGVSTVYEEGYHNTLKIEDNSDELIVRAERQIPDISGKFVIEYDIKPEKDAIVLLACDSAKYDADGNSYYLHIAHRSSNLVEVRGSTTVSASGYPMSQWHRVKVIINTVKKTAVVSVNGSRIGTVFYFRYPSTTTDNSNPLNKIVAGSYYHASENIKTSLLLDNLSITAASLAEFAPDAALRVSQNFGDRLTLDWPGAENAFSYLLYQDGILLETFEPAVTSAVVTNLEPGREYEFSVRATDYSGRETLDGPALTVTAFALKQYVYQNDFEGEMGAWTLYSHTASTASRAADTSGANGSLEVAQAGSYGGVLQVSDLSEALIMRAEETFNGHQGISRLSYDIKPGDQSIVVVGDLSQYSVNSNNYFVHIAHRSNKIEVRGSTTVTSVTNFNANEWHHVEAVINTYDRTVRVFVNNEPIGTTFTFRYSGANQAFNFIAVGSFYSASYTPSVMIDNIEVLKAGAADWYGGETLTAYKPSGTELALSWPQAQGTVSGYLVLVDDTLLSILDGSETSFTLSGLEPATAYKIEIKAIDPSGAVSGNGLMQIIKTLNPYGFTVFHDDFYRVSEAEEAITAIQPGIIRTRLTLTNDNAPYDSVVVLALVYEISAGVRILRDVTAVKTDDIFKGKTVPESIDASINDDGKKYELEVCVIDTVLQMQPISAPLILN